MNKIPQRIQRSRAKGYNMQQESLKLNGLPAVSVTRPGKYGNPFRLAWSNVKQEMWLLDCRGTIEECLQEFENYVKSKLIADPKFLDQLRGKNLACFCKPSEKCHADILLHYSNFK